MSLRSEVEPVPPLDSAGADMPPSPRFGRAGSALPLALCAGAVELCWLALLGLGDLRAQLGTFVVLFFLAFVTYLAAAWLALAGRAAAPTGLIIGAALLFRLTLLVAPPTLSDDLYRSVWEGRVLAAGYSPYRYPPDAPELVHLRDEVWAAVNNKGVPSPYPPLTQLYSVAAHAIAPGSAFGPKLLSTGLDLAVMLAILRWLRATGRPDVRLILYAWAPLPALEFAHSGHNDALMVLLLVAALALHRHALVGPALLAAATLAKIAPILLAPLLIRSWGGRGTAVFSGIVVLGCAPLVLLGDGALGSLPTYAASWSDNDSLFYLLRLALGALVEESVLAAKAASAMFLLAGAGWLALHPRVRHLHLPRRALAVFGLFLLLSSTVHAWYLTWLLPLLVLELRAADTPLVFEPLWAYAWLLFSGLVVLPYLTYADHQWQVWISLAQYLPLYLLLGVGSRELGVGGGRL